VRRRVAMMLDSAARKGNMCATRTPHKALKEAHNVPPSDGDEAAGFSNPDNRRSHAELSS